MAEYWAILPHITVAAAAAMNSDVPRNVLVDRTGVDDANTSVIKLLHSSFGVSLLITHYSNHYCPHS